MRRVEQRHPFAPKRLRYLQLFRDRVVAGRLRDGAEVLAERREPLPVLGPAEHDVLGVAIESRKLPEEIPDVGADAEVMELAGIDADPHDEIISGTSCALAGWKRVIVASPTRIASTSAEWSAPGEARRRS